MKTIDSSLDSLLKRNRCICDKSLFVFYVFFFLPCYCLLLFTTSDYISKIFNIFILVQMSISHTNGGTNEWIEKERKHMQWNISYLSKEWHGNKQTLLYVRKNLVSMLHSIPFLWSIMITITKSYWSLMGIFYEKLCQGGNNFTSKINYGIIWLKFSFFMSIMKMTWLIPMCLIYECQANMMKLIQIFISITLPHLQMLSHYVMKLIGMFISIDWEDILMFLL